MKGGCLFLDRYKSLKGENVLLSYQIWQDERSMTASRVNADHHEVQVADRENVFTDYRIRIAQVIHEVRPQKPTWRTERLTTYNDPASRPDLRSCRGLEECRASTEDRMKP